MVKRNVPFFLGSAPPRPGIVAPVQPQPAVISPCEKSDGIAGGNARHHRKMVARSFGFFTLFRKYPMISPMFEKGAAKQTLVPHSGRMTRNLKSLRESCLMPDQDLIVERGQLRR